MKNAVFRIILFFIILIPLSLHSKGRLPIIADYYASYGPAKNILSFADDSLCIYTFYDCFGNIYLDTCRYQVLENRDYDFDYIILERSTRFCAPSSYDKNDNLLRFLDFRYDPRPLLSTDVMTKRFFRKDDKIYPEDHDANNYPCRKYSDYMYDDNYHKIRCYHLNVTSFGDNYATPNIITTDTIYLFKSFAIWINKNSNHYVMMWPNGEIHNRITCPKNHRSIIKSFCSSYEYTNYYSHIKHRSNSEKLSLSHQSFVFNHIRSECFSFLNDSMCIYSQSFENYKPQNMPAFTTIDTCIYTIEGNKIILRKDTSHIHSTNSSYYAPNDTNQLFSSLYFGPIDFPYIYNNITTDTLVWNDGFLYYSKVYYVHDDSVNSGSSLYQRPPRMFLSVRAYRNETDRISSSKDIIKGYLQVYVPINFFRKEETTN